jgi:hypothetical protein
MAWLNRIAHREVLMVSDRVVRASFNKKSAACAHFVRSREHGLAMRAASSLSGRYGNQGAFPAASNVQDAPPEEHGWTLGIGRCESRRRDAPQGTWQGPRVAGRVRPSQPSHR